MDPTTARSRLEDERMRLVQTRKAARDLVDETIEDAERDSSVLVRVEAQLAEVDAALARLDAGTYGVCELCGRPVADGRLEAMPATRYCVDCQAQAEHPRAAANQ